MTENGTSHFAKFKQKLKIANFIFHFQIGRTAAICTPFSAGLVVSIISYVKNPDVYGESASSVVPIGHPWDNTSVTTDWQSPFNP